jgi:O-antigen/teichoic acid export membrane protein
VTSIFKDSVLYLIGELVSKALPFILLPYLTRTLGPAGFGDLSLYQVLVSLIFIIISLNHEGAIARYYFFYGKRAVALVVASSCLYSSIIFLIGGVFAIVFQSEILFILLLCAYTQSLINTQLVIRQMQKRVNEYLIIQLGSSTLSLLLTFAIFEFIVASASTRIAAVAISNISMSILTLFFIDGGVLSDFKKIKINCKKIRTSFLFLFAFGAPLLIHNISLYSKGQLDRILVYKSYAENDLGFYSAGFQIASILAILLMALNKALVPYFYENLKSGKLRFATIKQWIIYTTIFVPVPALFGYAFPESFYALVLGEEFIESKVYTVIFLLGIAVTLPYFIVVNYLFYHGKTKLISVSTAVSSVLHVILVFSIGQFSLFFMAFSLFFTNVITLVIIYFYSNRLSKNYEISQINRK